MPTTTLTTQSTTPWVRESPITMVEGESRSFALTIVGATTITGTPTCASFNADVDSSTTNLSGSVSVSGVVITTKVMGTVKGGESYTLATTAVVDGRTDVILLKIEVLFPYGQGS